MSDPSRNSSTLSAKPYPGAQISGVWLMFTRILWGAILLFLAGLIYSGISHYITFIDSGEIHTILSTESVTKGLRELSISTEIYSSIFLIRILALAFTYIIVGIVMYLRKSNQWVVLLYSMILFAMSILFSLDLFSAPEQSQGLFAFLGNLAFGALFFGFYIFPDGRFVPGWTRWLMLIWVISSALISFTPNSPFDPNTWPLLLNAPFFIVLVGSAPYAQIHRYRKVSNSAQRQQIKWVIFGLVVNVIGFLLFWTPLNLFPVLSQVAKTAVLYDLVGGTLLLGTYAILPLSIGFALLRYRLWDIDPIINRTLVYGLLTVSVILMYIIIVGYLGSLFGSRQNWFVSLFATGIIAVVFHPLRQFLQNAINRWLFGERDDPYRVISRLGHNLENTLSPEAILSTIVDTVRHALRLPYAAVTLLQQGQIMKMVSTGVINGELFKLPIVYQHETVGEFHLAPRAPGESFSPADRRLLEDLARQAGIAIHAVRATTELQQARERLVSTREEERRRLRRDLHDGLGPQLASQTLTMDAVYRQIDSDPQAAKELLEKLKSQTRDAVRDIRRLVYDLRPPALDELGLMGALREMVVNDQASLQVSFIVPDDLHPLPAAVEVATFRIVQEAIANVIRHANAANCYVNIEVEENRLCLKIDDDGEGMHPNTQAGIGLLTMRERAEELGGTFKISESEHGGMQVRVRLPLAVGESSL